MVRLDDVIHELQQHHGQADMDLVRRAYVFSAQAHRGQTRRNGEPYLTHPLEVAHIVSQLRLDTASVVAALLHDTVEDTVATVDGVRERFGDDIAFLVQGLTKLEKINFHSAEEAQAENFRKMLVAMSRDLRVIVVKLADRLHNMRTLKHLREEKQKRIARETLDIYAPLANRLGINWIKTELEDLSFKYLFPDEYKDIAERIAKTRSEREQYIDRVIEALKHEMKEHGVAGEVTGRPKHLWSIRQKIKTSGRDLDSLFDMLAFRIIVDKVAECYEALGLVHSLWKPIPGRFKDYIALPKDNSYQSLHTAVLGPETERIEIQIRTLDMHRTAELGVAAHWTYKEGKYGLNSRGADARFAWLRQLLEWHRDLKDPTDFMETVKVDLFANEVYVFTPEGDVRAFPRGATPVDFAYTIHTDLGHECTGAKVNGSQVPLRYQLQNGDVVEILRTKGSKPKPHWTKFVKTGRAATKIRAFLRQEENARAFQIGQEVLEKELKRYGVSLNKLRKTGKLKQALERLKYRHEKGDARRAGLRQGADQQHLAGASARGSAQGGAQGRDQARRHLQEVDEEGAAQGQGRHHRRWSGRDRDPLPEVLLTGARRRHLRLHHPGARRHRAPQGLSADPRLRSGAARRRSLGYGQPLAKAGGAAGVQRRPARPARQHEPVLPQRRRQHHRRELQDHARQARREQLHGAGQRPRAAQSGDAHDRAHRGCLFGRAQGDLIRRPSEAEELHHVRREFEGFVILGAHRLLLPEQAQRIAAVDARQHLLGQSRSRRCASSLGWGWGGGSAGRGFRTSGSGLRRTGRCPAAAGPCAPPSPA